MAIISYCSVSDVQNYFANTTFGENSPISSSKVTALIQNVSAMINAALKGVWVLPITAEVDLQALKGIAAKYVAGEVDEIQAPMSNNGQQVKNRALKKEAMAALDDLIARKKSLSADVASISVFKK